MFKGRQEENRFEVMLDEVRPKGSGVRIYLDKQTGVQYMAIFAGTGVGLAPLFDKDGKPVIDDRT